MSGASAARELARTEALSHWRGADNSYLVWAYREACFDLLECCFAGCHAVVICAAADVMRSRAAAIGPLWVGES